MKLYIYCNAASRRTQPTLSCGFQIPRKFRLHADYFTQQCLFFTKGGRVFMRPPQLIILLYSVRQFVKNQTLHLPAFTEIVDNIKIS